jgi:hypothetical protein
VEILELPLRMSCLHNDLLGVMSSHCSTVELRIEKNIMSFSVFSSVQLVSECQFSVVQSSRRALRTL